MKEKRAILKSDIGWDEYFFKITEDAALRSKDPRTKVGAVLVNNEKNIIGIGYNGFPPGFDDRADRWERPAKHDFCVHAEINAIFRSIQSVRGSTLYVPFWPCKNCAKHLAAAGIKKIHIKSDYYKNEISELIFKECNIELVLHYEQDHD